MDQPTQICQTCLGKDRKLVPISVFRHLLFDINLWEIMDNQGDVCLECHRTITKYYSFKTQAAKSQVLLNNIVQASSIDPLSSKNCNFPSNEDKNAPTELKVLKVENQHVKIEYKDVKVHDEHVKVQEKEVKVEDKHVKVQDKHVKVQEKEVKVQEKEVKVQDKDVKVEDKESDIEESLEFDFLEPSDGDDELLSNVRERKIETVEVANKHTLPVLDEEERQPVVKKVQRTNKIKFAKYKSVKHSLGTTVKNEAQGDKAKMYTTIVYSEEEVKRIRENKMAQPNYKQLPYKCDHCVLGFKKMDAFNEHMATKHLKKAGTNACDVCLCRYRSKSHLEKHRRTHFEFHKCNLCDYNTSGHAFIETHIENKHGSDSVDRIHCQACSEVFSNAQELAKHSERAHRLACDQCDCTFKGPSSLRSHKRKIHKSGRPYKCDECKIAFKTASKLESHIVKHGPKIAKKMSFCEPCGRQFPNIHSYRYHLKDSVRHAKDAIKCPICETSLYSKAYLKKHIEFYHLNKVKFACNECGKPFLSKFKLRDHLRTKHGFGSVARRHECAECKKKFTTRRLLRSHQLLHRPERRELCALCGDTFKQRSALTYHTKTVHSGQKRKKQPELNIKIKGSFE